MERSHPITLPEPYLNERLCYYIENVLTTEECQKLIEETERRGYEQALINAGGGKQELATDYRNSGRCMIDDREMATLIWDRIKDTVPETFMGMEVAGLNERLRCLKYVPGQYFKPHQDGCYLTPDQTQISLVTIQLYLNEGFEGGETTFISPRDLSDTVPYVPKTGSVLVFEHRLLHEGSMVTKGTKYSVRTDIMFYRNGARKVAQDERSVGAKTLSFATDALAKAANYFKG